MTFEGLKAVLTQLKKTHWQDQQAIEQLLRLWPELVGPEVAAQTRPASLSAQGILQVSTSSGVWAQNLAFERVRLLVKVRAAWNPAVKDIYFSPRQWYQRLATQPLSLEADLSTIQRTGMIQRGISDPKDAQAAFANWAKSVQHNANQHATRCPICECLTPVVELNRWGRCALCTSRPDAAEPSRTERARDGSL
jgi:predicted nucleic acid-binding Zn ribbon protein